MFAVNHLRKAGRAKCELPLRAALGMFQPCLCPVCLLELVLDIETWKTFARCSLPIGRATPAGMFSKLLSATASRKASLAA